MNKSTVDNVTTKMVILYTRRYMSNERSYLNVIHLPLCIHSHLLWQLLRVVGYVHGLFLEVFDLKQLSLFRLNASVVM